MVFLFSKFDIATAIGIEEKDAVEFLRLKLFQYGITCTNRPYTIKSVVDLLWDIHMNDTYKSESKFDILFGSWSTSFKEEKRQAIIKFDQSDVIQVELL